jgi:hypothetical protein
MQAKAYGTGVHLFQILNRSLGRLLFDETYAVVVFGVLVHRLLQLGLTFLQTIAEHLGLRMHSNVNLSELGSARAMAK